MNTDPTQNKQPQGSYRGFSVEKVTEDGQSSWRLDSDSNNLDASLEYQEHDAEIEAELADVALEQAGIEEPGQEELEGLHASFDEVMTQINLEALDGMVSDTRSVNAYVQEVIAQAEHQLATARYHGAEYARQIAPHLENMLTELRNGSNRLNDIVGVAGQNIRGASQGTEEATGALYNTAQQLGDQETARRLRGLDEAVSEMQSGLRMMTSGQEDMQSYLVSYGRLETLVQELQHDSWGYETTIAQISSILQQIGDDMNTVFRGSSYIESSLQDVQRVKSSQ